MRIYIYENNKTFSIPHIFGAEISWEKITIK